MISDASDWFKGLVCPDLTASFAAIKGAANHCPFCSQRVAKADLEGRQALKLSGTNAGQVQWLDSHVIESTHDLWAPLPLSPLPRWLAPFDIKLSWIIDELAVWISNRSSFGVDCLLSREDLALLASVVYDKHIAITSQELSVILFVHGIDRCLLQNFENDFNFAMKVIHATGRKLPYTAWRDSDAFANQWSAAMRMWGRH